ncbi:MAG: ABC transporter permease [Deltaproteobacteria bacterium]|nr:ABC transporter permease [Deltaproteobacteria bacterium]MCZ6905791.1 ABC transporter permease [Deltaproteobacteria bacterium]
MTMLPSSLRWRYGERMGALLISLIIGLLLIPNAEAIYHAKGSTVLEIRPRGAETILEDVVDKVQGIQNIATIERYLLVKTKPHEVIGIEPGAPLRVISRDDELLEGNIEMGRGFKKKDEGKNFAIVGKIYHEDYGQGMTGMAGMKHSFSIGQSFKLKEAETRTRVIGRLNVSPESEAQKVFLPLATAQKIYGMEGKFSRLFVTVKSPGDMDQVKKDLEAALGGSMEVVSR